MTTTPGAARSSTAPTPRTRTCRRGNCHGPLRLTAVLPENPVIERRGDVGYEGVDPQGREYGLTKNRSSRETKPTELALYQYGMGNLCLSAPKYRPKQNFFVVLQVGDADALSADKTAKVTRVEAAASDAVQFDRWALVFAAEPKLRDRVSYGLASAGARRHIVFDLKPGSYTVSRNGKPVAARLDVRDKDYSLTLAAPGEAGDEFTLDRRRTGFRLKYPFRVEILRARSRTPYPSATGRANCGVSSARDWA